MKLFYKSRMRLALNKFLDEYTVRSLWVTANPVKVYLRKGPAMVDNEFHRASLTLANISVRDESHRQGHVGFVLEWMEGLRGRTWDGHPITAIVVENVISDRMADILTRHGWRRSDIFDPPSFYKKL